MNNNSSSSGIVSSPVLVPQNLPVGWRFYPTDEELLIDYLKRKRRGDPIDGLEISEVQLYKYDPWDLFDLSNNKSRDKIRFFFCLREYYKNSEQASRKTPGGHWKSTGHVRLVTHEESDEEIGTRRTLVYHNPDATQWVIYEYEYTAELNSPVKGNFVLCKLKMKSNKKKKVIKKTKKAEADCNNARPNKKARKGKSDCNMASACAPAFENSNLNGVMANSVYGDSEPSNHMISDIDNQNSSKNAAIATYEKGESSYPEAFNYVDQSQYEMPFISTCNKGETSNLDVSAGNKDQMRCPVAPDLENHNPNEMTPTSSYEKSIPSCPMDFGLENQNSYDMSSNFDNQNHLKKTDMSFLQNCLSPLLASDVGETTFQEVQSQHKEMYIPMASSSQEGEEAMSKEVQNQYKKDTLILEDNCPRMAFVFEEDTFPELDPQEMEELFAYFELQKCLNDTSRQPIHTNKLPNHSTSLSSVNLNKMCSHMVPTSELNSITRTGEPV